MKPEKKERILNAAMREFAEKGFEDASTNEIVKEAGISKGILFHYFKSKKELFLFLYDYTIEILKNEYLEKIDFNKKDIFERLKQVALLKFEIFKKHPEMYNFVKTAYFEEVGEVKEELERRYKELVKSNYGKIFEDIDTANFKDGLDVKRAVNIIIWTVEGFSHKEQERLKRLPLNEVYYDEMLSEMDIYLEMLKCSFYK